MVSAEGARERVEDRTTEPAVRSAVLATYAVFITSGFAFASWASRIPQVRDHLALNPSQLGLLLLSIAAGSLVSMPSAGVIVGHFGSRWTVRAMGIVVACALVVISVGYLFGVVPLAIGLFFFGFGQGAWDVAMNVQGALAERRLGRAIMPRFHAGWSVGTVAGALIGAGMVALRVPVTAHLAVVAVLVGITVPIAVRGFLADRQHGDDVPVHDDTHESEPAAARNNAFRAWREPRTLIVGLFVLAFAFAEGTGNDWISIAMIDGYGTPAAVGTLCFAIFLAAMTAGRWFGPSLLDRYGRVVTLRALSVVCLVGVLLFVFGPYVGLAFLGAVLWGGGLSLGFPVGMSAGADQPAMAAPRVSVIASIGYCAFLGGPPLVGFLGSHLTVRTAILSVAVLVTLAMLITGWIRPPAPEPVQAGDTRLGR